MSKEIIFKGDILEKEYKDFYNTFFGNIKNISEKVEVDGRPCVVSDVLFNDKEYLLYEYRGLPSVSIALIPKDFDISNGIYDDVVEFSFTSFGFYYKNHKFGTDSVEQTTYSFILSGINKDDVMMSKAIISSYIPGYELDKLCKTHNSLEEVFSGFLFSDLVKKNRVSDYTIQILRNNDSTRYTTYDSNNIIDNFNKFMSGGEGYENIDDNESPLYKIVDRIHKEKIKK